MPEKSLTVATYAAGASLAAITLIYVFGPTYFLDSDAGQSGGSLGGLTGRKKGVVGLSNPANDCFINSILQVLAGLGDLRLYLIRELHRRSLDDTWVYAEAVPAGALENGLDIYGTNGAGTQPSPGALRRKLPDWKVQGLQSGLVTKGLKDILDQLNERPIYKKIISAGPFVRVLEQAFRQRISRQQQDAQEFLQVVAERLCDEYHAGHRARKFARRKAAAGTERPIPAGIAADRFHEELGAGDAAGDSSPDAPTEGAPLIKTAVTKVKEADEEEEGFPMEGKYESQIECLTCGFKPKPTPSTFCTLTLNVPQVSSTTLNACFDGMFKTEYIDDFKCEKCRLLHAQGLLAEEAAKSTDESFQARMKDVLVRLQRVIDEDPENPPDDLIAVLPDPRLAPKRKIARHIRLTSFPKILAIHLSRSIYDASQMSTKNSAKVAFPEQLPLGGLLKQQKYKLLGMVTHKGSHHSGHYETFRRQNMYPPFSTPNTFQPSGIYSRKVSPAPTPKTSTPQIRAVQQRSGDNSPLVSTPDLLSPSPAATDLSVPIPDTELPVQNGLHGSPTSGERPSSAHRRGPTSAPRDLAKEKDMETTSLRSMARRSLSKIASSSRSGSRSGSRNGVGETGSFKAAPTSAPTSAVVPPPPPPPKVRRKKQSEWWRISDEKVKDSSTREALGMQREVYLLFYELERTP